MSRRSSRKSFKNRGGGPNRPSGGRAAHSKKTDRSSGSSIGDQLAAKGGEQLKKLEEFRDARPSSDSDPKSVISVQPTPEQQEHIVRRRIKLRQEGDEREKQKNSRKLENQSARKKTTPAKTRPPRERQIRAEEKYKNQSGPVKVVRRSVAKKGSKQISVADNPNASRLGNNHEKHFPASRTEAKESDIVTELDNGLAKLDRPSPVSLSDREFDRTSQDQLNRLLDRSDEAFKSSTSGDQIAAVIGFDFGTSSTKIVVQVPRSLGGEVAAALEVPAYFRADEHPHLWSTTIWASRVSGEFSLSCQDDFTEISDIKTQLMGSSTRKIFLDGDNRCGADIVAIAYIALLIRVTVSWIRFDAPFEQHEPGYNWSINLGVPAARLDNEQQRKELNAILAAAWLLAESDSAVTVENVKLHYSQPQVVAAASNIVSFTKASLCLIPEIVAEAVGFVKSQQANEGLHIMIDVGASTLDACSFNLSHSDGQWNYNIFSADVRLFGTFSQKWVSKIASDNRAYSNKDLESACEIMLRRIVWHTKKKRDPNAAAWKTELPILVCGGGREDPFYDHAKKSLRELMKEHSKPGRATFRLVPPPTSLATSCSRDSYHRLAVAWGLSFEEFELGDIRIPSEIDDIGRRPTNDYQDKYIDKDQV